MRAFHTGIFGSHISEGHCTLFWVRSFTQLPEQNQAAKLEQIQPPIIFVAQMPQSLLLSSANARNLD
jgi:hypothetical protein